MIDAELLQLLSVQLLLVDALCHSNTAVIQIQQIGQPCSTANNYPLKVTACYREKCVPQPWRHCNVIPTARYKMLHYCKVQV